MSGGAHPEDRRKHAPFQPAGRSGEARRSLARERAPVKPDELEQALILLLQAEPSLPDAPPARQP